MVNLTGKKSNDLAYIKKSLEDNLNINPVSSRLSDVNTAIQNNRYTFKLIGESCTLPINSERPSLLVGNRLFVGGGHVLGYALCIINTDDMSIIKQIQLAATSISATYDIISDGIYYYMVSTGGYVIKGLISTGEVLISKNDGFSGSTYQVCIDGDYLLVTNSNGKLLKLNKSDLSLIQTSTWTYTTPISLKCLDGFGYLGGSGSSANNNFERILKIDLSDLSIVATSEANGGQIRDLLAFENYIYTVNDKGHLKKWDISDLSPVYTVADLGISLRRLKYKMNNFWIGGASSTSYRINMSGNILSTFTTAGNNFILEIDETNQILYLNASTGVTVQKYQIIDNLQNSVSDCAIKTNDLIALNTSGLWDGILTYTYNSLVYTFTTLTNGYLRQFTINGTASADTVFNFGVVMLSENTDYIINSPKTTDRTTTIYTRVTLSENPDGSGTTQVINFESGVCEFSTTSLVYAKSEIVIKSGTSLSSVLHDTLPVINPR